MPRIRLASLTLCAALGIAVGSPAAAQVNDSDIGIDLTVGRAVQRDGDRLLALGLHVAYLPAGWWIQPEVGYEAKLFPLFGGEDNEVTAGLRSEWPVGTGRLWVGGGYAKLRRHWGSEVDHSEGWYARAGAMWPVGRGGFHMGFEGKLLRAPNFGSYWDSESARAGSQRVGLLLGWRI